TIVSYEAMRRLPSLASLRAFEAAARHLSFKHASAELAVTPTAIQPSDSVARGLDWSAALRSTTAAAAADYRGAASLPSSARWLRLICQGGRKSAGTTVAQRRDALGDARIHGALACGPYDFVRCCQSRDGSAAARCGRAGEFQPKRN